MPNFTTPCLQRAHRVAYALVMRRRRTTTEGEAGKESQP